MNLSGVLVLAVVQQTRKSSRQLIAEQTKSDHISLFLQYVVEGSNGVEFRCAMLSLTGKSRQFQPIRNVVLLMLHILCIFLLSRCYDPFY